MLPRGGFPEQGFIRGFSHGALFHPLLFLLKPFVHQDAKGLAAFPLPLLGKVLAVEVHGIGYRLPEGVKPLLQLQGVNPHDGFQGLKFLAAILRQQGFNLLCLPLGCGFGVEIQSSLAVGYRLENMPKWLAPKVQPMYAVPKLYDVWFAFYTTPFCIRKSNGQQKC